LFHPIEERLGERGIVEMSGKVACAYRVLDDFDQAFRQLYWQGLRAQHVEVPT